MPVDVSDVMRLLSSLSDEAKLRVTVKESVKGGIIAGVSCAIGGVVGGPVGLAVGGTLGGCAAAYLSRGKFVPASQIIMEMDKEKQLQLYNDAKAVIDKLKFEDFTMLASIVAGNMFLQKELIGLVVNHIQKNMKMTVID